MFKLYDTNLSYRFLVTIWRITLRFDWWYDVHMRHNKYIPLEVRWLTQRAADGATGFCECGYMAKYPICTKCGRAYPPRR